METDRLLELIDEAVAIGVFDITLAGGEPMMHPDFFKILEHSVSTGVSVGLLTNGTFLSEKSFALIEKIVEKKPFVLQVSLDAPTPDVNDQVRGKGDIVRKNLLRIASQKTSIQIQISTVLTTANIKTAHEIIEEFYPLVRQYHFLNVQETEWSSRYPEILINGEQEREFWLNLLELSRRYPPDLHLPSLVAWVREHHYEAGPKVEGAERVATFDCKSCVVGLTHVHVTADYDLLGCDIAKHFSTMGNLRSNSLAEVYHSSLAHRVRNSEFPPCYLHNAQK